MATNSPTPFLVPSRSRSPRQSDGRPPRHPGRTRLYAVSSESPEYSDDPDDDTDEDLANVPSTGDQRRRNVVELGLRNGGTRPPKSHRQMESGRAGARENRGLCSELHRIQQTILQTTERRLRLGFERIQICLFMILGIFTVNRIQALLSLQLKHLQLSIQRDPLGGPPIPMVELRAVHTKQFLGIEQHPHVFLFGILFSQDAFEARTSGPWKIFGDSWVSADGSASEAGD
ncbi:hypothetical protein Egran_02871 [Elaphomyces granulatus]|uniref:Uncharacterized protein n=1 Tax=Elaphomyces granulatus TaxID=519963 RepID=A0A232LZV6_9EURO|nr:hypothetical protein Egran_02871 [Elaphomyces granulatus]